MFNKFLVICLLSLGLCGFASTADRLMSVQAPGTLMYTGPGDVISGAWAFWSLRAYSSAIVTAGTQALVNLEAANTHTCDIIVNSSGGLGNTANCSTGGDDAKSVLSWLTRQTFTGTMIGGTVLSTTSDSCVAADGDQILGSSISTPTTVITVISCSAGTGAYVVSQSWTFSAESMTDVMASSVAVWYDQSGSNSCASAACNVSQSTQALQPTFYFDCYNSLPCIQFNTNLTMTSPTGVALTSWPFTYTDVVARNTGYTSQQVTWNGQAGITGIGRPPSAGFSSTSGLGTMNGGASSPASYTMSNNDLHVRTIVYNKAGSASYIDTSYTLLGNNGTASLGGSGGVRFGSGYMNNYYFQGELSEAMVYTAAWNSTQAGNMCHNLYSYWTTVLSC